MKNKRMWITAGIALALTALATGAAISATDQEKLKVPGGLSFSEFKGYESWAVVSISQNGPVVAAILGNPAMIAAYKSGIPENGKPFPDGAKMAKIHWLPKKQVTYPGPPTVAGELKNVDFMVKDSKRFADSGGWGYAVFEYDTATASYRPGDMKSTPPQGNDAKCGAACHVIVKNRDSMFTEYAKR